ncbi:MAG: M23 family peptidase [Pseudolabrys sp.]
MSAKPFQLVALAAALVAAPAMAQEMVKPRVTVMTVDWRAALDDASKHVPLPENGFPILNDALRARFPGIDQSTVPVLLPVDLAGVIRDKAANKSDLATSNAYFYGFDPSKFFQVGPAGYDATFFIDPRQHKELDVRFSEPVEVAIAGAAFVYEIDGPNIAEMDGEPRDKDVQAAFPGIRRILREAHLRYAFERFGVPYVVSIECFNGRPRPKRLPCKDADKIALAFLERLKVAGGTPGKPPAPSIDLARPKTLSQSFTFYAPGDLIEKSGWRQKDGRADRTVYALIRFPMAKAPAFAKSQSYNPWGDCYHTGIVGRKRGKGSEYRCKVNSVPLVFDESHPRNFSYPWRDNYCENRDSQVGQCPGGYGHQGQDIRGSYCLLNNEGADRCEPYQHDVVAVRSGLIWRKPGNLAAYISVNTANDRVRFRYLHLTPDHLDADGIVTGRRVEQGEVIGRLSNYGDFENGTSYHLHFDGQVFTRDGWVWFNPYMTLVSAYERLIGARGTEVKDGEPAAANKGVIAPLIANRPPEQAPAFAANSKTPQELTASVKSKAKAKPKPVKKKRKARRKKKAGDE